MNENNACSVAAEVSRPFQVTLLSVFDEIAQTVLKTTEGMLHTSLQSYLDGGVAIGGAYVTRRAILLAIHDLRDDLEAPRKLQEKTLTEAMSLKIWPAPDLRLYRDIATALLRMEVVVRFQANRNGNIMH